MKEISFNTGALIVGVFVWIVLAIGILLHSLFIIILSSLTLGLVSAVWIVMISAAISEHLKKRKYKDVKGADITYNYVSFIDPSIMKNNDKIKKGE
ncbi:MAG: hypothetical protein M1481_01815 [Candidatus Thermoplasmatota archaeon]|nr:hypothetical protein [Candidatus Thermoplasmatota archaeon]MCL5962898.1 hypothetical protein [Candidatus Thermoplasmatota archaeon]